MNSLNKKYGFWTATAMVVGIVIGSGVFFKAPDVLKSSGGSLPIALTAWLIGGAIMIVTAYVFSKIATKIEKVNGVVDYFEEAYGKKAGYNIAWFMTIVYYPTIVCVLAWVSGKYTVALLGIERGVWLFAILYLILFYSINLISPVLAGKWQVSATIIKLLPLVAVGIVGTITGLLNGQTVESFTTQAKDISSSNGGLALATLSTAFAYEGWIIATTINAEIKDAKKNLPKALVLGTFVIVLVYILYYLGIAGVLSNEQVILHGKNTSLIVISNLFGNIAGTLLSVFVVISCLGTLNGLIMGSVRGMFSISVRGMGPKPSLFKKINSKTNSTINSGILGFIISLVWLMVWYGNFAGWFNGFMDISELPIAFLYVIYLSMYIWVIRNFKDLNIFERFVAPILAGCGSLYIIWGAMHKDMFVTFSLVVIIIYIVGVLLRDSRKSKS